MVQALKENRRKYLNKMVRNCLIVALSTFALFILFIFLFKRSTTSTGDDIIPIFIFGVAWVFSLILCLIFKLQSPDKVEKEINKFCAKTEHPEVTKKDLEKTWETGVNLELGKINTKYLIVLIKGHVYIAPVHKAVWIFGSIQSLLFIRLNVVLFIKYKEEKQQALILAWFKTKCLNQILAYLQENCPDIAVGLDREFNTLYQAKNWEALLKKAHKQRGQ